MSDQTIADDAVESDDAPFGQIMFLVFGTAVVFVSSAVGLLSISSTWWMLGLVCTVHLTATVIVCLVIARALTGRTNRRTRTWAMPAGLPPAIEPGAGASLSHAA